MHSSQTHKLITLIAVLLALTSCARLEIAKEQITQSNINLAVASLDSRANELLMKTGLPGMAIAVVQNDKVIYAKGFGVRKLGTNLKVDADTVFQLASVSKSLASTVVAGAIGHGRVQWEDRVAQHLPGFTTSNPAVGAQVTIAEMFAHRSGLPSQAGDLLEFIGYQRSEIISRLRYEPLNPFLVTYGYSNFGLTVGAEAVAVSEGLSWEDLSKKELYDPLGMTSTSSRWSDYDKAANKADIHKKNNQDKWEVSERQPDAQSPSGGVSSSARDMAKWMMLELGKGVYQGKQIINKEALLQTWQLPPGNVRAAIPSNQTNFYGLGINVKHDAAGQLRLSHSGAFSMGASTTYELLPSLHLGIAVLTNGMPIGVPETIAQEFVDIVEYGSIQKDRLPEYSSAFTKMLAEQGKLVNKQRPTNPTPALPASAYVGTYANDYYGSAIIEASAEGLRLLIGPNRMIIPLRHWDGNAFSFVTSYTGLAELQFTPAQDAQPTTMKLEFFDSNGLGTFTKVDF